MYVVTEFPPKFYLLSIHAIPVFTHKGRNSGNIQLSKQNREIGEKTMCGCLEVKLTQKGTAGMKKSQEKSLASFWRKRTKELQRHTQTKRVGSSCCSIGHKNLRLKKTPGMQDLHALLTGVPEHSMSSNFMVSDSSRWAPVTWGETPSKSPSCAQPTEFSATAFGVTPAPSCQQLGREKRAQFVLHCPETWGNQTDQ